MVTYPKVSICVPIYGVEKYISKCADSLFKQTYENIEYIFVNDKTKDNSIEVLNSVIEKNPHRKSQISIIEHSENSGLSAARETAIQNATGTYLMHVDSDDYLEPNTVKECVDKALKVDADVVIFGMIHEFKKKTHVFLPEKYSSKQEYLKAVIRKDIQTGVCGKLYKRSLYIDNNIHCLKDVNFGEDYAVYPRLIYCAEKISFIEKPYYHYLRFNESSYTYKFNLNNVENMKSALHCISDFFKDKALFCEDLTIARQKIHAWIINYVFSFSNDNDLKWQVLNEIDNDIVIAPYLSINHRIILTLAKKRKIRLLNFYIKVIRTLYKWLRPFLNRE